MKVKEILDTALVPVRLMYKASEQELYRFENNYTESRHQTSIMMRKHYGECEVKYIMSCRAKSVFGVFPTEIKIYVNENHEED